MSVEVLESPAATVAETVKSNVSIASREIRGASESPPLLDARFAALKREIISQDHEEAVTASYERLKKFLEQEAERIEKEQQTAIPEVQWADVAANGMSMLCARQMLINA